MSEAQRTALETIVGGWETYQGALRTALTPLTPEQLAWRPAPHLHSIGELATHIVAARAGWFHYTLGEGDSALAAISTWDGPREPARTAAELVHDLDSTWDMIRSCLARWTPADLAQTFEDEGQLVSRQWVVWHLIEHDLHHGGELSYSLGILGLPAVDI